MSEITAEPVWRNRMKSISCESRKIVFPDTNGDDISQDKEWCEVYLSGAPRRIRFHDYHRLYAIPGLYEQLFYERLKCSSPSRVARLLEDVLSDSESEMDDLRILDLGAGNGMVGDELHHRGSDMIVGVDIIEEAKEATLRDRPGIYDHYYVTDFTSLPDKVEQEIRGKRLNSLTTVAALGFGDIPSDAFLKALDMLETPGWLAFNIKEDFLDESDTSGFSKLIRFLSRERFIQPQAYRRYPHRLSITGEPLYYVAMVARKKADIPRELLNGHQLKKMVN